jgi:hypothetical protein
MRERNIVRTVKRRKANWIGRILHRNCLLKHVIKGTREGRVEVTIGRGGRRKPLLDDVKEKRGQWTLREEVPYFSIDNAHLMYNAHQKLFRHSF